MNTGEEGKMGSIPQPYQDGEIFDDPLRAYEVIRIGKINRLFSLAF